MQIDIQENGAVVLIEPVGDIDGKTAPKFHDAVLKLVEPPDCPEHGAGCLHVERRIALDAADLPGSPPTAIAGS